LVAVALLTTGCDLAITLFSPPGDASWALAEGQELDAETEQFVARVTEMNCASGQSSEGRIVGPKVEYGDDAIIVTFAVRPPPGGEFHTCQGNPPTLVLVTLSEPLGDRQLLDGHVDPPVVPGCKEEVPPCDVPG
jgi:hypothetical protein